MVSAPPAPPNRQLADLADLQAVGLGLYLALAIIQVVSSGGVATLRRKHAALASLANRDGTEADQAEVRKIATELNRLEIATDSFHSAALWVVSLLFSVALGFFVLGAVKPHWPASTGVLLSAICGYILAPLALYVGAMWYLRGKADSARKAIKAAQRKMLAP